MTDDLRARIECAIGLHPVIRDGQTVPLADAVLGIVQPIADERDQLAVRIAELEAQLEVARSQGASGTAYLLGDLAGMYSGQVATIRTWATTTTTTGHEAAAAEVLRILDEAANE
ncbi:hypothetical protein [Kitasatospora kifunensis]|uniref:Uncharacterized protein n=1 Tax=Kitasatospora kifunensis TaxID=58351 RepID=A0A7W7VTD6_KITKI|nr:hypothetical protein [Kitasatospora kifunensis]MBB4922186.1 hypothetical protein [Kitasatospora kifunensis]